MGSSLVWCPFPNTYLTDVLRESGAKKIVDIGCGTGGFSLELALKGAQVTGIDITEEAIKLAEYKKQNLHLNKKTFVENVWKKVVELDKDGEKFLSHLSDEEGRMCCGDFDEHENYTSKLPIKSENLQLEFKCEDALKLDYKNTLKGNDCIIMLDLLHILEPEESNPLLENVARSMAIGAQICLAYLGPSFRLTSSVPLSLDRKSLDFANMYGREIVSLGSVLSKMGFKMKEETNIMQQKIAGYVAQKMFPPSAPAVFLMQCYMGTKTAEPCLKLEQAVIETVKASK